MAEEQEDLLDLDEIMRVFGVDDWTNLGPMVSPSTHEGGGLQVLVEIEGQRYMLKERREGLVAEESNQHHYAFRQFLQEAGIPIPALFLTPQGKPVVTMGDEFEEAFELEQVVEGVSFRTADQHNRAWVSAAGAMLARIHQASLLYPGPVYRWPSETHIGGIVQGYLNLARVKAEQSEIAAITSALSNWCDQWEAMLPSAMVAIGSVRGLPEFHIHGDYHALNLRFAPHAEGGSQDVTAVLNLEASHWEKRVIELAYGLFYFSTLEWNPESPLTRPLVKRGLDPERARLFLEAYSAIYPPVPNEASILGDALMLISPIATINGPLEDVFFTSYGMDESVIDDLMERLAWATSLPTWLARVRRSLAEMWG